ncbi:MAG: hypothetical protein ACJA09_001108 [Alcanivorax sp.]|jgi:hypothetical protein
MDGLTAEDIKQRKAALAANHAELIQTIDQPDREKH